MTNMKITIFCVRGWRKTKVYAISKLRLELTTLRIPKLKNIA